MRLTIKALGWIIILLWIIVLALPISVAFSLIKLAEGKNLGVQEPTFTFSNGNISINMPVYVNNTGFYEISEANVKIRIGKADTIIVAMSKSLPNIPAGQMVNTNCCLTASLREILQKDPTLLTEDANLEVNAALHFRVAYAIAFNIAYNYSTEWGAPFHNLTYSQLAYNYSTHVFSVLTSFNNHAFFSISGPLTMELFNSNNIKIGETSLYLDVPSGEVFREIINIAVDPSRITDRVLICLFFDEWNILETEWTLP
ncbi:MAG: hypothetical protein QXL54_00090 [Candidatus Bathyarchaeia archaeon]